MIEIFNIEGRDNSVLSWLIEMLYHVAVKPVGPLVGPLIPEEKGVTA